MRLEFIESATTEFEEAMEWYAAHQLKVALAFRADVNRLIDRLLEHPLSAPLYFLEYRAVVLSNYPYRLVFRVTDDALVVVALRHTSRDPEELKSRLVERP